MATAKKTRRGRMTDPATTARRRARAQIGSPPPGKAMAPKKLRPPKHKKPLTAEDDLN
ncbi:MAG: hypothetical protein IT161_20730 [Bryobacterales bacterium]|nr:hypothetical protein [Bryobacterales bacterium]